MVCTHCPRTCCGPVLPLRFSARGTTPLPPCCCGALLPLPTPTPHPRTTRLHAPPPPPQRTHLHHLPTYHTPPTGADIYHRLATPYTHVRDCTHTTTPHLHTCGRTTTRGLRSGRGLTLRCVWLAFPHRPLPTHTPSTRRTTPVADLITDAWFGRCYRCAFGTTGWDGRLPAYTTPHTRTRDHRHGGPGLAWLTLPLPTPVTLYTLRPSTPAHIPHLPCHIAVPGLFGWTCRPVASYGLRAGFHC